MNKKILIIFAFTHFLFPHLLHAQDSLKTNVFNVEKTLKPILSEAIKIQSNPNPEVPEIKSPTFDYTKIPDGRHNASPTIYAIRPLSMGTSLLPKLKNNYTILGYGNLNSPLFETYLSTGRSKELQAGIFLKHFSSNPNNNAFSNNTIDAFVKKFSTNGVLESDVKYFRNNIYLYGLPDNVSQTASPDRQLFQTFALKGSYSNIVKDSNELAYKIGLSNNYFFDNNNIGENTFKLYADIGKRIQGNMLEVKSELVISDIKYSGVDFQRTIFDFDPRYTLEMEKMYLELGFNSCVSVDTSEATIPNIFPVAEVGYTIIEKKIVAFAGITGNENYHTYQDIANENPFIHRFDFRKTRTNFEVYGGVKGKLSPQTSFILQAGWSSVQNLLFYAVDSGSHYTQRVIYDTSNAGVTHLKAELSHEFNSDFRFTFTINYYKYNLQLAQPFSRPTLETKLNVMYNIGDKFILRADIFTMNERHALVYGSATTTDVTLKGLVDLNAGIDYLYNKNIAVFLNFNNLTNNLYQRWYAYPVYGFTLLGGLKVTF